MEREIIKKLKIQLIRPRKFYNYIIRLESQKRWNNVYNWQKSLYNEILRIYWIFLLGVIILSSNNYDFLVLECNLLYCMVAFFAALSTVGGKSYLCAGPPLCNSILTVIILPSVSLGSRLGLNAVLFFLKSELRNWCQFFTRLSCYWSWISSSHCQSSCGSTRR